MKNTSVVPDFINEERKKGASDEEIKSKLVERGWHIDIINEAIKNLGAQKPMPLINENRDKIYGVPKKPLMIGGLVFLGLILLALFI